MWVRKTEVCFLKVLFILSFMVGQVLHFFIHHLQWLKEKLSCYPIITTDWALYAHAIHNHHFSFPFFLSSLQQYQGTKGMYLTYIYQVNMWRANLYPCSLLCLCLLNYINMDTQRMTTHHDSHVDSMCFIKILKIDETEEMLNLGIPCSFLTLSTSNISSSAFASTH